MKKNITIKSNINKNVNLQKKQQYHTLIIHFFLKYYFWENPKKKPTLKRVGKLL